MMNTRVIPVEPECKTCAYHREMALQAEARRANTSDLYRVYYTQCRAKDKGIKRLHRIIARLKKQLAAAPPQAEPDHLAASDYHLCYSSDTDRLHCVTCGRELLNLAVSAVPDNPLKLMGLTCGGITGAMHFTRTETNCVSTSVAPDAQSMSTEEARQGVDLQGNHRPAERRIAQRRKGAGLLPTRKVFDRRQNAAAESPSPAATTYTEKRLTPWNTTSVSRPSMPVPAAPTIIKELPGIAVERFRKAHGGKLPSDFPDDHPFNTEPLDMSAAPGFVIIWSGEHRAWWRPDGRGYTIARNEAGIYSHDEAVRQTQHCGPEKLLELQSAASSTLPLPLTRAEVLYSYAHSPLRDQALRAIELERQVAEKDREIARLTKDYDRIYGERHQLSLQQDAQIERAEKAEAELAEMRRVK